MDRDLGATSPYPEVTLNRWNRIGNADVMYVAPGLRSLLSMLVFLRSFDQSTVLYLNSFFSRRFSIFPILLRRLRLIRPGCVVLAPRGEFSPGALQLKNRRKMLHIRLSQWLGLYRGVVWHASSELEAANILQWFRAVEVIRIASVIPELHDCDENTAPSTALVSPDLMQQPEIKRRTRTPKTAGGLRVVFLSRISPMKNLLAAISMLPKLTGQISLDIYGPLEDLAYWNACKNAISKLPPNILVHYSGEVEHSHVFDVFAKYDLFLFPTLGENYGHVICEALGAGCPVLTSDQTPWRGLANDGVGWDIPLREVNQFSAILQQCVDADEEWYAPLRARAKEYARKRKADPGVIEANRKLFETSMNTVREESFISR